MERIRPERPRKVDCFYVHPTVSDEPGLQAPLRIDDLVRVQARHWLRKYG